MAAPSANWKNVNNWHWYACIITPRILITFRVERDCSDWAHDQIRTRLQGLKASHSVSGLSVTITNVSKVEGDVTVTQRKGRLRHNFDLNIVFDWETQSEGESEKGTVEIRDWMSDTTASDFEFYVKSAGFQIFSSTKSFLQSAVRDAVWTTLQEFTADLVDEHGKHLIVPVDSNQAPQTESDAANKVSFMTASSEKTGCDFKEKSSLKNWKETIDFTAPPKEILRSLVEPERVQVWSRGSLSGSLKEANSVFGLYGGAVSGRVLSIDWDKFELQLAWRLSSWPADHHSTVIISLKDDGRDGTRLNLMQTDIPADSYETTTGNWSTYYWNPIKTVFGCGALPF